MSKPSRTLLLCFIHGFKGDAETFYKFPEDLRDLVSKELGEDHVETAVYPKYETRGDLAECTLKFVDWLKEQVIAIRKKRVEVPWPPNDRSVGVVLVAHSMGGFVASDAIFSILNDRAAHDDHKVMFPLIQGMLAFDTPYNGLARSMFVYGGFSQYQKVSSVWNIMSAASAGIYSAAALGSASSSRAATRAVPSSGQSNTWKLWQGLAVRSGAAGAIAAGGVAAYMNRAAIIESAKNLNKNSIKEGYTQGYDMLGQGLAYINRDSLGHSFAWLSSHLKFVGALLKQKDMNQRLERLASLEGIGLKDIYASLGENGYWTGGYFVPERTFCAIPESKQKPYKLFTRTVNTLASDEIQAHMTMFRKEFNDGYEAMSTEATAAVVSWFNDDKEVVDIVPPPSSPETTPSVNVDDGEIVPEMEAELPDTASTTSQESPLDIAAAAASIALPEGTEDELNDTEKQKYLQTLFRIASSAGGGLTSFWGKKGRAAKTELPEPAVPSTDIIDPTVIRDDEGNEKGEIKTADAEHQDETGGNDEKSEVKAVDADGQADDLKQDDKVEDKKSWVTHDAQSNIQNDTIEAKNPEDQEAESSVANGDVEKGLEVAPEAQDSTPNDKFDEKKPETVQNVEGKELEPAHAPDATHKPDKSIESAPETTEKNSPPIDNAAQEKTEPVPDTTQSGPSIKINEGKEDPKAGETVPEENTDASTTEATKDAPHEQVEEGTSKRWRIPNLNPISRFSGKGEK